MNTIIDFALTVCAYCVTAPKAALRWHRFRNKTVTYHEYDEVCGGYIGYWKHEDGVIVFVDESENLCYWW